LFLPLAACTIHKKSVLHVRTEPLRGRQALQTSKVEPNLAFPSKVLIMIAEDQGGGSPQDFRQSCHLQKATNAMPVINLALAPPP